MKIITVVDTVSELDYSRIRILLFSSVAFKMATKISFVSLIILTEARFTSGFKDNKL